MDWISTFLASMQAERFVEIFILGAVALFAAVRLFQTLGKRGTETREDQTTPSDPRSPSGFVGAVLRLIGIVAGTLSLTALAGLGLSLRFDELLHGVLDWYQGYLQALLPGLRAIAEQLDAMPNPFQGWWLVTGFMGITIAAGWAQAAMVRQVLGRDIAQFAVITAVGAGIGVFSSPTAPLAFAVFWGTLGAFAQLLLKGLWDRVDPKSDAESVVGRYIVNIITGTGAVFFLAIVWIELYTPFRI